MSEVQSVDPTVSRAKFEREVAQFREHETMHRQRGIFLLGATFPEVFVLLASPRVRPSVLIAGVVIDFANYDLKPPSVTFVNPFSREPIKAKDLTISMPRRQPMHGVPPEVATALAQQGQIQVINMIQFNGPEEVPFLCLPGVREYHDNPAHTGDSWLLHRRSGEGSLHFILEQIWKYGVNPFDQFQISDVKVTIAGLAALSQAIPE